MSNQVIEILTFVVLVAYVAFDKLVLPKIDSSTIKSATDTVTTAVDLAQKLDILFKMANQFVILAKKEMTDATGEEKRDWVIEKLKKICEGLDIVLDEDSLKAINEGAYTEMKKSESTEVASNTTA